MTWIPLMLGTFKAVVFCVGMYLAIKWHHDQGKKKRNDTREP